MHWYFPHDINNYLNKWDYTQRKILLVSIRISILPGFLPINKLCTLFTLAVCVTNSAWISSFSFFSSLSLVVCIDSKLCEIIKITDYVSVCVGRGGGEIFSCSCICLFDFKHVISLYVSISSICLLTCLEVGRWVCVTLSHPPPLQSLSSILIYSTNFDQLYLSAYANSSIV